MRLNAYYYSFQSTGTEFVDRVLSAVACAGKAFHHTEDWTDEVFDFKGQDNVERVPMPYEPFLRGWTPIEWIQGAADDAAKELDRLREENARLRGALTTAINAIREWHNMNLGDDGQEAWLLYQFSPEMTAIYAALACRAGGGAGE
jgi:hypothetical protein